ncbi:MAG: DUF4230 domain-containing protein [Treponema sp.]|nr:DUF4230 domain-containing protein [Treponema sp.]
MNTSETREKSRGERAGKKIVKAVAQPMQYLFLKILGIVIAVCALGAFCYFGWQKLTHVRIEKKYEMAERQLVRCQELVTLKMRYSDVASIKKSAALGLAKSYSIVKFTGVVRVGIADISKSKIVVSADGKTVTVTLPKSEILGNDIESMTVFDEKGSIFVPIKTQEIFENIDEARKSASDNLLAGGVLSDADVQAEVAVRAMLQTLGFKTVVIK